MSIKRLLQVAGIIVLIIALSGWQTDATTTVQSVNTFMNVGQLGILMYLLYRADTANIRQRTEQNDQMKMFLGMLEKAWSRTPDEKK